MVNIGILVGHKIGLLSAFIFPASGSFLLGIRSSSQAVNMVARGTKKQIDQPLDGPGFNILGDFASAAQKGKRQIGSN